MLAGDIECIDVSQHLPIFVRATHDVEIAVDNVRSMGVAR